MPAGRPQFFTQEQIQQIYNDLLNYILEEEDPTIVWFTSIYNPVFSESEWRDIYINKDFISDHDEFSELRKKAIEKQENYLVKWVTKNQLNATMWVFRLKQPQHWYTDKQEIDSNVNLKAEVNNMSELPTDELIKLANGV